MVGSSPVRVASCDAHSEYLGRSQRIWSGDVTDVSLPALAGPLEFSTSASLDVVHVGDREFLVDPSIVTRPDDPTSYVNHQGRFSIDLAGPEALRSETALLGLVVTPGRDLAIGVALAGSDAAGQGMEVFRYYPGLRANRNNLILLSKLGFDQGVRLDTLRAVSLVVYTTGLDAPTSLSLRDATMFSNALELKSYLEQHRDLYFFTE